MNLIAICRNRPLGLLLTGLKTSFYSFPKAYKILVISFFLSLIPIVSYSAQELLKEPWDNTVFPQKTTGIESSDESNFVNFFRSPIKYSLASAVKFYQYAISPVIGSRCSMYPSCSQYSVLALRKYGGLVGFVMTADRLMHEAEELQSGPIIEKKGIYLVYDPVENNDFWWNK